MATLLAAFLSFLVLTAAVDAAACIVEEAEASLVELTETHLAPPAGDEGDFDPDPTDSRGCAHCQCHHGSLTAPSFVQDLDRAGALGARHPILFVRHRPSLMSAGPERPPRA